MNKPNNLSEDDIIKIIARRLPDSNQFIQTLIQLGLLTALIIQSCIMHFSSKKQEEQFERSIKAIKEANDYVATKNTNDAYSEYVENLTFNATIHSNIERSIIYIDQSIEFQPSLHRSPTDPLFILSKIDNNPLKNDLIFELEIRCQSYMDYSDNRNSNITEKKFPIEFNNLGKITITDLINDVLSLNEKDYWQGSFQDTSRVRISLTVILNPTKDKRATPIPVTILPNPTSQR